MAIWGDYHTHTIYSHGTSTIEQNVAKAVEKGLKEIAITDHGFRHMTYQVRRSIFHRIRKEVEDLKANNFLPITLGPRILRTQVAPLYIMSALSYEWEAEE